MTDIPSFEIHAHFHSCKQKLSWLRCWRRASLSVITSKLWLLRLLNGELSCETLKDNFDRCSINFQRQRYAWFPYDRPDRPSRFKKILKTIRTTGTISGFHMIVSIASKTRDAGSSAMSPGQTIELLRVFRKQANNIMMDFNRSEPRSFWCSQEFRKNVAALSGDWGDSHDVRTCFPVVRERYSLRPKMSRKES